MKRFLKCLLFVILGIASPVVFQASANLEVSASVQIRARADFYSPLATHGTWIEVGAHGRCWRPVGVAVEWRPYCNGHWVWTDCGWYWDSDEPWAWACYHYGSWVYESDYGWCWVPGVEWAPAWVSWRTGGGYFGWAPLPPPGVRVVPGGFVFVDAGHFHEPVRPSTVVVNNTTIINKTTVLATLKRETRDIGGEGSRKVVINEGPGVGVIEQATGKKIRPIAIQEAVGKVPVPPDAVRKINESRKKTEAPPDRGQAESSKDRNPDRQEIERPAKDESDLDPNHPPAPGGPREKPLKPGKDKGRDKGKGKD